MILTPFRCVFCGRFSSRKILSHGGAGGGSKFRSEVEEQHHMMQASISLSHESYFTSVCSLLSYICSLKLVNEYE